MDIFFRYNDVIIIAKEPGGTFKLKVPGFSLDFDLALGLGICLAAGRWADGTPKIDIGHDIEYDNKCMERAFASGINKLLRGCDFHWAQSKKRVMTCDELKDPEKKSNYWNKSALCSSPTGKKKKY
jgi:hypothetical protein